MATGSRKKYWSVSIYIAVAYAIGIHLLQKYRQHRKPRRLRIPLCLWNASLAIFSTFATIRFGEEFLYAVTTRPFKHSICYSISPESPASFWACAFAISKVAELGDTFFVVMRKKPLIFLHWYHHAVVLVYSWNSACELTAAGRWFIFMNYFVHSFMYTYYTFTAYGIRMPRIISIGLTTLQTMQMLIGVVISVVVLQMKLSNVRCQQSMENLALCFAIYASFAVLFMRFFYDSYIRPRKSKEMAVTEAKQKQKKAE
uniref:Elongation of very long chain fatty acids protein n=1 Tax=Syphacia muris TaxID=451379 RepID=A0A0N5AJJ7_9BILA